jgi:hypothetical protein
LEHLLELYLSEFKAIPFVPTVLLTCFKIKRECKGASTTFVKRHSVGKADRWSGHGSMLRLLNHHLQAEECAFWVYERTASSKEG